MSAAGAGSRGDVTELLARVRAGEREALDRLLPLLRAQLEIERRVFGPEHPAVSQTMGVLGIVLRDARRLDESEALFCEVAAIERRTPGEGRARVAGTLSGLAATLMAKGEHEEGAALYRQVISRRVGGFFHCCRAQLALAVWRAWRDTVDKSWFVVDPNCYNAASRWCVGGCA